MRAWIITEDLLPDIEDDSSDIGAIGPSNAPNYLVDKLQNGEGFAFEMFDDDGILYYRGRAIWDDNDVESGAYGPLGDFGDPNAGCTSIRYPKHPEFDCA